MSGRATLLPHPALSAFLLMLWLLLNNSAAPGHLVLGALLGVLIPLFTRRFWPERLGLANPGFWFLGAAAEFYRVPLPARD